MSEELENDLPLSRTKQKQQAKEIEQLAEHLAAMPDKAFKRLTMSEDLTLEVRETRATKGHGSQKRQIKYLAGMLRKLDDDVRQLQEQLQGLDKASRNEKKELHQLEKLRDRLCEIDSFDQAYNELLKLYPQIDGKVISGLAKSVHQYDDKRAFREIFKRLRDGMELAEA